MTEDKDKNIVLALVTTASFITPFMVSAVAIALPTISRKFGMDAVSLSWVPTAYSLAAVIFLVPMGRIADIYGRKKIFVAGIVIYTLSSVLCALSVSGAMLIAARVVEGIGASMIFGTAMAIVISVFPPAERGKALGINVAGVYLGLSLGPVLGGFMTQHLGWRSVYLFNLPLGALILFGIRSRLKGEWAEARDERFSYAGAVIYGAALFAFMFGMSRLPGIAGFFFIAAAAVCALLFVMHELRQSNPLVDIGMFVRNRVYAFSNAAALINYSATSAVAFLLSLYLQYLKGLSPQRAGLILICQPAMMAVCSPIAGRLSDRIEPRLVASCGMMLNVAGLMMLCFIGMDTGYLFIITSLLFLGLGFGLFSSPNTNAVMSSVEKRQYGIASGTLGTMRLVGQMLSLGIAMLVFSIVIGRVALGPANYPAFLSSIKILFAVFAGFCLLGVFASLSRGRIRSAARPGQ